MSSVIAYFAGGFLFTLAIAFSLIGVLMFWPLSSRWSELGQAPQETRSILVYVSGAVKSPGVYELAQESRVYEVVDMAGGFDEQADKDFIASGLNLASGLEDGQHLLVPMAKPLQPVGTHISSPVGNFTSINAASQAELEELPGIGPQTALQIISARPFTSVEELLDVSGIGPSKYNQIKDLVSL